MKVLVLLVCSLCVGSGDPVALQEFTLGSKLFTADIYKEVSKTTQGNFLISPFSIQTVLALTQSGAKDDTALEIRSRLRLPDSTEKVEAVYAALLPALKPKVDGSLRAANRIYVKNDYPLNENFKSVAANVYQAGIENVDFSQNVATADSINEWVEKQTENKIRDLIDPKNLNRDTRVVLVNALYFKKKWKNPFDAYSTYKQDFYRTARDVIKVDTMHKTDDFNYYESPELNAKFLEIPYEGDDASMVVVLPNEKEGLAKLENQIEQVFTTPRFTTERVSVSLPKFTIENKFQLTAILKNLGINKMFSSSADLSGIAGKKGELYVSDVVQKTFINVTEEATEAAAASAVLLAVGSSAPSGNEPKDFDVDHPFVFYIKVKQIVLFEGKITKPEFV